MIQPQHDANQTPIKKRTPSGRLSGGLGVMLLLLLCFFHLTFPAQVQAQSGPAATPTPVIDEPPPEAPNRVDVEPAARDEQISARLTNILMTTGWFIDPQVEVQDGVVFLTGQTRTDEYKKWAGDLARGTQDVVAVVNQISVLEPPIWDFQPAFARLREQWRGVARALPLMGFSLFILLIAWILARLGVIVTRNSLRRREINPLLRNVIARAAGILIFLIGLYVVFQVAGLTNAALTVLGGTGLLGLILGIAFRDITENFLASIFLSLQNPFRAGDLVEIAGITGFVQMLTTRTTVLMTPDGNHVQIPNATVYKSTIHNYTSNPNRRADFTLGIGYDDAIPAAQDIIMQVLADHPAVLNDPEPLVLVDSLGSATVNLHIYFWLDGSRHSWLKVKSAIIRLVKRALQDAGVSMPDEARELIFPNAVPIQLLEADGAPPTSAAPRRAAAPQAAGERATASTGSEGGLRSEAEEIEGQARHSRAPEEGENLLKPLKKGELPDGYDHA